MSKWIFGLLAAVVGIPVAAAIAVAVLVNPNDYKPELESLVLDNTGRVLELKGDIGLSFFPWLGFEVAGVSLANKAGFSDEPMLTVKRAEARLKLLPLFTGSIEIGKILLDSPSVVAGIDSDGSMSWSDLAGETATAAEAEPADEEAGALPSFGLASFEVSDASLKWIDKPAKSTTIIKPFDVSVGQVSSGKAFPISLTANVVQGSGAEQMTVALELTAKALMDDEQLRLSDVDINSTVEMAGLKPIDVALAAEMVAKLDGSHVALTSLKGEINSLKLTGDLSAANLTARPNITMNLAMETINTDDFLLEAEASESGNAVTAEQSAAATAELNKTPVDVAALKDLDMLANITAEKLIASGLQASNMKLTAVLKNGLLNVKPLSLDLYEGTFSANASVNANARPAKFSWQHQLTAVNAEPMQVDVMEKAYVSGSAEMLTQITTQGAIVGALRKALQGKGSLAFHDGAIKGVNISGLLRKAIAKFKNEPLPESEVEVADTDFSSATASFTIVNGLMNNPDLLVQSPLIRITGQGDVNLVDETVDYRARPMIVASLEGQGGRSLDELDGIPIPVRCTGPMAAPKCRTDIAAAVKEKAKMALDVEKDKARAKLDAEKDEAKEKLKGKLDDKVKDIFNKWR